MTCRYWRHGVSASIQSLHGDPTAGRRDEVKADMREAPSDERPPSTPRWVKVIVVAILGLLLIGVAIVLAGGEHGPGRHGSGSSPMLSYEPELSIWVVVSRQK